MNRQVSEAARIVVLFLFYVCLVAPVAGQSTNPPYPGAESLPVDQEVTWFIALTYARRANVAAEQSRQDYNLESFATPESVEVVLERTEW